MIEEVFTVKEEKEWSVDVARDINRVLHYLHKEAVGMQYLKSAPTKLPHGTIAIYDDGTYNGMYYKTGGASGGSVAANIPKGGIILWSGAVSAIPAGWAICDGSNGTPNLTDRFIIHADSDSGGTRDVGDTGGSHTTNLEHNHGGTTGGSIERGSDSTVTFNTNVTHHQHNIANALSSTTSTIPKFYALAYIMKT